MPRAHVRVLMRPPYHGAQMARALHRMGYFIANAPGKPGPDDLLVLWNRYARDEAIAKAYEAAGARVVVVENGYFGRERPGGPWFAMALGQHNGAGRWPIRPGSIGRLGLEPRPWRANGEEIVVLATRNMGSALCREPVGWSEHIAAELGRRTSRPIRIRRHPGPQALCDTGELVNDLGNAWAAVTWGSGAGLKALVAGVPVFHGFARWIGREAARPIGADLEAPWLGERGPMLEAVASAMWSLAEIKSGEAFRCLLA